MFGISRKYSPSTVAKGRERPVYFGCSSLQWSFCLTELRGGRKEGCGSLFKYHKFSAVPTELQQIFQDKRFFICCMPLGPFSKALNAFPQAFLNFCLFVLYVIFTSFTWGWACRAPHTVMPEVKLPFAWFLTPKNTDSVLYKQNCMGALLLCLFLFLNHASELHLCCCTYK